MSWFPAPTIEAQAAAFRVAEFLNSGQRAHDRIITMPVIAFGKGK